MNAIYRMGAAVVLMLALLSPAMACVLPSHRPSAAAACCKRMNGDCSVMKMPVPQQCCQMKAHAGQITMVQPQTMPLPADSVRVRVVPVSIRSSVPRAEYRVLASVSHPSPILRI
ncbi:MAG TPA: hypothetical protein VF283_20335 [Bryobacteraceae bacterium]